MEGQISVKSWSDILKIGEKYSLQGLREKAANFVFENFNAVRKTPEFHQLPKDVVCFFLNNDFLKPSGGEIQVFRAARSWIEEEDCRIGFLKDLMKCVRFAIIPNELIKEEVLGWHKLYKEPSCASMVTEALCYHAEPFSQPLYSGKQFCTRGMPGIAVLHAGFRGDGFSVETTSTDVFLFTSKFTTMAEPCPVPFAYQSITCVTKGNFIFLLGTDSHYFGPVSMRYDVNTNKWAFLATPNIQGLIGATSVCCDQDIYLIGGILVDKSSDYKVDNDLNNDMFKYSIRDNMWSTSSCRFPLERVSDGFYGAFAAATELHGNLVFLAGGYTPETGSVGTLRVYNVKENTWYAGADMKYKRSHLLLEGCSSILLLYAVGGLMLTKNGQVQRPVSLVEAFNVQTDQWTVLNTAINISSATSHFQNGIMYIVGGHRGCKNEDIPSDAIIKFDTRKDMLITTTKDSYPSKCPIPCIHHGSALVSIPRK